MPENKYLSYEEAAKLGAYPDDPSPEEIQQHSEDPIEVYDKIPGIREGKIFEEESGILQVGGTTVKIPPILKQTATIDVRNKKGETVILPATQSMRGGGLKEIPTTSTEGDLTTPVVKNFKKASHKVLTTRK